MKLKTKTLTFYYNLGEQIMKKDYIKYLKEDALKHGLIASIEKMMISKIEANL
jgi:hypothetical protein